MSEPVPDQVSVVGIGADGWDGLSGAGRELIGQAEVIFGSPRQLRLIPDAAPAERIAWPSPLRPALAGLLEHHAGRRRCVLASGDPMLFGIGSTLADLLGPERLRVAPAVSSVSLACARLGWAQDATEVVSVVGRPVESVARRVSPGRRLLVLSADERSPAQIAQLLVEAGYGASLLVVLQELGGPDERIARGVATSWEQPVAALNIVAVECVLDPGRRPFGAFALPDAAFCHDGQLTKQDVRALTLTRLSPAHGELLWDVGAGSGSIGIEWLRAEPSARAVAVERDRVRAERMTGNAARLGVPGLQVVVGDAPGALAGLPAPDAVFIGGGLTVPDVFERCWQALKPGGRLVVNAVTVESEAVLLRRFAEFGGELTRLAVSRAEPVGGFTGWRPAMPLTQWTALKT